MARDMALLLYALLMIAIIVSADFLFFRHKFWLRLIANIGIVLLFIVFYFLVLKRK